MQIYVNGIILFAIIFLIAVGFSLVYQTTRFFHFAHAVTFTAGAYFAFLFTQVLGLYLYTSIPLALAGACLLGVMIEWFIYKPLRKKKSSAIVLLLAG